MGDDDMIRRGDAIAKCRAMADEAKSYGMPQMAMGGYASAEAIAAIPAAEAEAEAAALRALVARMEGALDNFPSDWRERAHSFKGMLKLQAAWADGFNAARAALTDGGKDG